jgi:uncharacterized membrane protein YgcG
MKKLSTFAMLAIMFVVFFGACKKNDNTTSTQKDKDELISEAKNYFITEIAKTSPGKTIHTASGESITVNNYPVWEYATVISDSLSNQTVIVPILAPYQYASQKGGHKTSLITRTTLVIYKDKDSKLHAEVKVRLPDENNTTSQFSGLLFYQEWNGKPLKSFLFKEGRQYTFASSGIRSNPAIVETAAPIYVCYDVDHYTCVSVGEFDYPCNYEYTTTNCELVSGGGGGGGGGGGTGSVGGGGGGTGSGGTGSGGGGVTEGGASGWPYPPVAKPGDRLCPSSFLFTNQSQTGAFYLTNMTGMRIEDGSKVHLLPPTVFSLTNGITDLVMKSVSRDDYLGQNKTPIQYLREIFPELFPNEIKSIQKNGKTIWNFSPEAAAIIAARAANLGGQLTATVIPSAALPGNPLTDQTFFEISNSIIKAFMPGSAIIRGSRSTATNSSATYDFNCKW